MFLGLTAIWRTTFSKHNGTKAVRLVDNAGSEGQHSACGPILPACHEHLPAFSRRFLADELIPKEDENYRGIEAPTRNLDGRSVHSYLLPYAT